MPAIISKNIRVRCPECFIVGEHSIIDDFSYFSTKVKVGKCSHIASGCTIAGGKQWQFTLGDYSSISSGVKIWCASDSFKDDIVTIIPPQVYKAVGEIKTNFITGDVCLGNFTAVGANAVVMPSNNIPEGTVIGALSFVTPNYKFKPWSVYAGSPIRFIEKRDRKNVLHQVKLLEKALE